MKHLLLSVFTIILYSVNLNAQSLIVTSSGQPITAYDVTVTDNAIYYRAAESTDSQFVKLDRDSVSLVRHADGTIVNLVEQGNSSTSTPLQNNREAEVQIATDPNDYLDHEYNKAMIAKYNTPAEVVFKNEKDKKKKAKTIFFQHYATQNSQFASSDLILSISIEIASVHKVHVLVENRSDKTIFVDLANTYFVRNGVSEPYYTPSATSSSVGKTAGASINLGGIANAVGIGGVAGTVARGVNVGGSRSNYSTNITYSQRVISIPPYSKQHLEPMQYILESNAILLKDGNTIFEVADDGSFKNCGNVVEWEEKDSPYKISCFLTYSFNDEFNMKYTLNTALYMGRAVASSGPGGGDRWQLLNPVYYDRYGTPKFLSEIENCIIPFAME